MLRQSTTVLRYYNMIHVSPNQAVGVMFLTQYGERITVFVEGAGICTIAPNCL